MQGISTVPPVVMEPPGLMVTLSTKGIYFAYFLFILYLFLFSLFLSFISLFCDLITSNSMLKQYLNPGRTGA